MIRDFTKEELAPAEDATVVTLGSGAFLALGGGLLLLCAICFVLGYTVGHRGAPETGVVSERASSGSKAHVLSAGSAVKPGAAGQVSEQAEKDAGEERPEQAEKPEADEAGSTANAKAHSGGDGQTGAGQKSAAFQVQSAAGQTQGWMVQIAAVSHAEDAEVLVDALRKRGYSAAARREVGDNLIHVQTGPFVNRNDANAMRQKLLNDGYNAIVQ
jgi:cell division septation protein DedD